MSASDSQKDGSQDLGKRMSKVTEDIDSWEHMSIRHYVSTMSHSLNDTNIP